MRDFREEYKAFLREYPYKTIEVDSVTIRYQRGGKDCLLYTSDAADE